MGPGFESQRDHKKATSKELLFLFIHGMRSSVRSAENQLDKGMGVFERIKSFIGKYKPTSSPKIIAISGATRKYPE